MSIRYTERLAEVGASASVGSVADSYDNAMAEALNGTFKAELIEHQGPWRDFAQVERALVQQRTTPLRPRLRPARRVRAGVLGATRGNPADRLITRSRTPRNSGQLTDRAQRGVARRAATGGAARPVALVAGRDARLPRGRPDRSAVRGLRFEGHQGTAQSISSATFTSLTLDTETIDSDGGHSTVTNPSRYTIQVAGTYFLLGQACFPSNATGNRGCRLQANGANIQGGASLIPAATGNACGVPCSAMVSLSVGDYVEIQGYQTSGAALNTANPTDFSSGLRVLWISG